LKPPPEGVLLGVPHPTSVAASATMPYPFNARILSSPLPSIDDGIPLGTASRGATRLTPLASPIVVEDLSAIGCRAAMIAITVSGPLPPTR
jgi:hypothetical protein